VDLTSQQKFHFWMHPGRCHDCWDSTLLWTPQGIRRCESCVEAGIVLSPAAKRLSDAVWLRMERKQNVLPQTLLTARLLIHSTSAQPVSRESLQGQLRSTEREVKAVAQELRREWFLPIGSSRRQPSGYYWMHTPEDFLNWSRAYRSQAIDELVTLHKLQRNNFPELAGQDAFDFIRLIQSEMEDAIK